MIEQSKRNKKIYKEKTRAKNPKTYQELANEHGVTVGRIFSIVRAEETKLKLEKLAAYERE